MAFVNVEKSQRASFELTIWFLLVIGLLIWIRPPSPMKAYRPLGTYHYLTLGLIPIGAWRAAQHGGSRVTYFLYGVACTALVSLALASSLRFWASDATYRVRQVAVVALPIVSGLCCVFVAWFRSRLLELDRMPENACQCGYDLTGNVSGRCPECGTMIPPDTNIQVAERPAPADRPDDMSHPS